MSGQSASLGIGSELLATIVVVAAVVVANLAISAVLRKRTRMSRETKLRASVFWRNTSLLVAVRRCCCSSGAPSCARRRCLWRR